MDKNSHTIDDIFNTAYNKFEEEPSAGVWEKLNAGLNKKDSELYKKKFIGWKRIAILLLFLFLGFVIYELGVIKKGLSHSSDFSVSQKAATLHATKNNSADKINNAQTNHTNNSVETNSFQKKAVQKKYEKINAFLNDENTLVAKSSKGEKNTGKSKVVDEKQQPVLWKNKNKDFAITGTKKAKTKKHETKQASANNSFFADVTKKNNITLQPKISTITDKENKELTKIILLSTLPHRSSTLTSPNPVTEIMSNADNAKKGNSKFKSYWTATGFASVNLAQYRLENGTQASGQQNNEKELIGNREKHEASFSAGIMANRQLKKYWGLQTGFIYSNTLIAIDPQKMYAAQQANGTISYQYITSSGYAYIKPDFGSPPAIGDSLNSSTAQHNLQSLSIPVLLLYKIDKKKFSILPAAGFTANFITSATVNTEVENTLNKEKVFIMGLNGMKNFYFGLMANVTVQYHLTNRLAITLFPSFQYALTQITKYNVVKTYPYNLNIGGGITCKF